MPIVVIPGIRTDHHIGLLPLGLVLLAAAAAALAAQWRRDIDGFILAALIEGAVWAVAAFVVFRSDEPQSLPLILAVAILMRLVALAAPVYLSTDIYRYVWDGRVAGAGINPYRYIPDDPHLAALRDAAIFPNINRAGYAHTIYPPAAEMLFFVGACCGGVLAMKLVMVAAEAVGIAALLSVLRARGRPRQQILLYAWHPLAAWEIAGSGHVDAGIVMFVALAFAAALRGRRAASAAALAAATTVKFFPAVLVPAVWRPTRANRGDWRWPAVFAAVVAAAYLPFLGAGRRIVGFLPGYLAEERFESGGGFWVLALIRRAVALPTAAYLGLAAAVLLALVAVAWRRSDAAPPLGSAPLLASAALFLLSPHYAWYFVWLVALLCAAPWWPGWWPTLTAVLLYKQSATGEIPTVAGIVCYGGFALCVAGDMVHRLILVARMRSCR